MDINIQQMQLNIQQVAGFIPQTNINISDSRPNTLISNIKIERKIGMEPYVTILQTDSDDEVFNYNDANEFGKIYTYRVSYQVYQKQTVTNSTTNKANYWKENWKLNGLKVDSTGVLYGTGTAVANDDYLSKLNAKGQKNVNFTAYIGNGGDKKGKYNANFNNLKVIFRSGTTTTVNRVLFLTKAWNSTVAFSKRFWYYLNKKDIDGKRVQIQLTKDPKEGIDLELYFKRVGNTYTYGYSSNMNSLKKANGLSSKGGKCTRLTIELSNGARISPDFTIKVNGTPTYKYVLLNSYSQTKTFTIRDEPDVDYGIVMNEYGEGFRFRRYEPSGLVDSTGYETKSTTQMLDVEGSELPLVYINDNKKTPSTNITIRTDHLAWRNRIRNQVLKRNLIYIYTPKAWNYQLKSGFYAYEQCTESRAGNSQDIYLFTFSGARQVLSGVTNPPKWSYKRLMELERNYTTVIDDYKDYADLAVSPTGSEVLGERESTDEIL